MGKSTVKENASAIDEIKLNIERLKSAFAENLAALENRLSDELKKCQPQPVSHEAEIPDEPEKKPCDLLLIGDSIMDFRGERFHQPGHGCNY